MVYFSFLDLFQSPVLLKFERKEKTSTYLGIICSLGIYIFLLINLAQSDIFYKNSPLVISFNQALNERPLLNYDQKIFAISVEDDNAVGFNLPEIFNITVTNYYMKANQDGDFEYFQNDTKNMHLCRKGDDNIPDDLYDNLGFSTRYCMDDSFDLQGFWNEDSLKYLEINVNLCDNITMNGTCQSMDEIKDFFYRKYFNIYFSDLTVDPSNYETPMKFILNNQYYMIDLTVRKILNIYFKNVQINTDDGFVFSNNEFESDIVFDQKDLDQFSVHTLNDSQPLFQCEIYSSQSQFNIQRVYQKMTDCLSNIGGMASILIVFGYFITETERSLQIQKRAMNALYSFQELSKNAISIEKRKSLQNLKKEVEIIENHKIAKTENLFETSRVTNDPKPIASEFDINENETDKIKEENTPDTGSALAHSINNKVVPLTYKKEDTLNNIVSSTSFRFISTLKRIKTRTLTKLEKVKNVEKLQEYMDVSSKTNMLNFNIIEYMRLQFKRLFKRKITDKEKLFLKGVEIYDKELDIVYILRKLQEIEKIKLIIFDNQQLTLFNILEKPLIFLTHDEEEGRRLSRMSPSQRMTQMLRSTTNVDHDQLKKVFEHFENLKTNSELTDIDKRLMDLVNNNLQKFNNNFN